MRRSGCSGLVLGVLVVESEVSLATWRPIFIIKDAWSPLQLSSVQAHNNPKPSRSVHWNPKNQAWKFEGSRFERSLLLSLKTGIVLPFLLVPFILVLVLPLLMSLMMLKDLESKQEEISAWLTQQTEQKLSKN